jgi:Tat protein translocase TatC
MTAVRPPQVQDDLKRMSFGDHLDELRSRLVRALLAVLVCVGAMVPFKEAITEVYIQPYRQMWSWQFDAHVEGLAGQVTADQASLARLPEGDSRELAARLLALKQNRLAWCRENYDVVQAGRYPFPDDVKTLGGFQVPYTLKAIGGIEDIWVYLSASMLFGLVIASPIVLYQAWAFVGAGLYRHERRAVTRYLPLAITLLLLGVAFGYKVLVPFALYFLVQMMCFFQIEPMFSVSNYFGFLLTLTAALGAVFQLPLLMLVLHRLGIVRHEVMRKHWRYVILAIVCIAAVFTPPDPFTMCLMAAPMILLYGFGLLLTARAGKSVPKLVP